MSSPSIEHSYFVIATVDGGKHAVMVNLKSDDPKIKNTHFWALSGTIYHDKQFSVAMRLVERSDKLIVLERGESVKYLNPQTVVSVDGLYSTRGFTEFA